MIKNILLGTVLAVSCAGCGVGDALDSTKNMGGKIDATNEQVKESNTGIKKTTDAIHKQTLAVALNEMMKPENSRYFMPPTGMLPGGKVFSNEATSEELIELVYVFMQEINKAEPDDSEKDPATGKWKPQIDHDKFAKYIAAQVIMGLAPQKVVEQMVKEQITMGGQYELMAYTALKLRYDFIDQILLDGSLYSRGLKNPGTIEESIKQTEYLTYISDLPYADKIGVKLSGAGLSADHHIDDKLDVARTLANWKRIDSSFDNELDAKYKTRDADMVARISNLKAKVKWHIPAPTPTPSPAPLAAN